MRVLVLVARCLQVLKLMQGFNQINIFSNNNYFKLIIIIYALLCNECVYGFWLKACIMAGEFLWQLTALSLVCFPDISPCVFISAEYFGMFGRISSGRQAVFLRFVRFWLRPPKLWFPMLNLFTFDITFYKSY